MGEDEQTGLIDRIQRRLHHGTMEPQELRRLPSALSAIGLADRVHIEDATRFIIQKTGSGEMCGKELLAFMRRAEQLSFVREIEDVEELNEFSQKHDVDTEEKEEYISGDKVVQAAMLEMAQSGGENVFETK